MNDREKNRAVQEYFVNQNIIRIADVILMPAYYTWVGQKVSKLKLW